MGNVRVSSNDTNYVAARRTPADVITDVNNGVIGDVRSTASQQMMPIAAASNTPYYFDLVYGLRDAKCESLHTCRFQKIFIEQNTLHSEEKLK